MSDVWERHFNNGELFPPTFLPGDDADGDGESNLAESIAGTDPLRFDPPQGRLMQRIRHVPATWLSDPEEEEPVLLTPEAFEIDWDSVSGKNYILFCSPDLTTDSWIPVGEPIYGYNSSITIGNLPSHADGSRPDRLFWRIAVSDLDSDGDTLTDYEEHLLGLNIINPSSHFGMPDLWLATHYSNLFLSGQFETFDPNGDSDGDGISNIEELLGGSNPNSPDSPEDQRWLALQGTGAEDIRVPKTRQFTIPAGQTALVIIAISSGEYPYYTDPETTTNFNDILEWKIEPSVGDIIEGQIDVNARHVEWEIAETLGETLPGLPGPVHYEEVKTLTAPPTAALTIDVEIAATNIGDGSLPSHIAVGLLPMEVVPDYNRDGKIDSADRGKVTAEKPWRFWVNDNNDSGTLDGSDIPGGGSNGNDSLINGIRDLVDWFPVFLDIKAMLEIFPSSQYDYVLENEDNALSMVETTLSPETASDYLKAELGEPAQRNNPNGIALAHIAGYFKHVDQQDAKLSTAFLSSVEDGTGGVIILEATKATDKPLKLVVRKKSDGEKMVESSFALSIQSVEKMYRHLNILSANGQSGGLPTNLGEPQNQPDAESSSKNFVFLHGYNVNPNEARGWFAGMFKKLWHSGSRARFTGVTWYGYESQGVVMSGLTANYQANALNAFGSASALKDGLELLGGEITIAAHSLGNMVVSSAMHDFGLNADKYFLIDAAVAKECYDETEEQRWIMSQPWWEDYDDQLRATDWHLLPWPENDWRAQLTWVNRFKNIGNAYNFYSSGEDVLKNPEHGPSALPHNAEGVWAAQEKRKGFGLTGQILTSTYGGWSRNPLPDYGTRTDYPLGGFDFVSKTQAQLGSVDAAFKLKLMIHPFFNAGYDPVTGGVWPGAPGDIANLYGANGSDYASPPQKRNTLLADMIPAQTTAAGSNPINSFGGRNFDMNGMKTGWPATRDDQRWRHSDIRAISYTYTFQVFDQISQTGALKE